MLHSRDQAPSAPFPEAPAGGDPDGWRLAQWARGVLWLYEPADASPAGGCIDRLAAGGLAGYLHQAGNEELARTVAGAAAPGDVSASRRPAGRGVADLGLIIARALGWLGGRARHEAGVCHVESWPPVLEGSAQASERRVLDPAQENGLAEDDPLVRRVAAAVLDHHPEAVDLGAILADPTGGEDRFHIVVAGVVEEVGGQDAGVLDRALYHVEVGRSGVRAVAAERLWTYGAEQEHSATAAGGPDWIRARQRAAALVSAELAPKRLAEVGRRRREQAAGLLGLQGEELAVVLDAWEHACPLRLPPPTILAAGRVRGLGSITPDGTSPADPRPRGAVGWTRILELSVAPPEPDSTRGGPGTILHLGAAAPAEGEEDDHVTEPPPAVFAGLSEPMPASSPGSGKRRAPSKRGGVPRDRDLRAEWDAHHARLVRLGIEPPKGIDLVVRGEVDGALAVWIPPGSFPMGSDDGNLDERPVREVFVDAFHMDLRPVTRAMFAEFVRQTGYPAGGPGPPSVADDRPLVDVTWHDAEAYCEWSGKRLPTEAEWEKAARGPDARRYPWGDEFEVDRVALAAVGVRGPVPVGSFARGASPYGLLDMAGNVWEWVNDWYDPGYYGRGRWTNPPGPSVGTRRVQRGGSWICHPTLLRGAARHSQPPSCRSRFVSFRCAS